MIARKGRERTMKALADEALDKEGVFACLSVDSIYNIFHPSDPIAYLLNPCVDSKKGKDMAPSVIRNVNTYGLSTLSSRMFKMFDGLPYPFQSSSPTASPSRPGAAERATSGYEMGGTPDVSEGSKAERRFQALNPHGTLDFQLPTEGLSEYVDMITAHASYWADPNFAAFLLAEIFARKGDLARTGLGLETPPPDTLALSASPKA